MIEYFAAAWCIGWIAFYIVLRWRNAPLTENRDEYQEDI